MSARDIIAVCQRCIGRHPNDCAGFVKDVADACGVLLTGNANAITNMLSTGRSLSGGAAARQAAIEGNLVIGGVRAPGHGHVVVVVDGPLNRGRYPYAFWGQYSGMKIGGVTYNVGITRGHGNLNYAFRNPVLDSVIYAAFPPVAFLLPKAGPNEGIILQTFT